jgi:hypothetical protein
VPHVMQQGGAPADAIRKIVGQYPANPTTAASK